jgi:anti-sigma factor RsiW
MRCRKVPKLLSLRIDGLIPPRQAADLEQHLARCADCRLVAERLERAWGALARVELPYAAPDDWAAIVAGVEARRRPWLPAWLECGLAPSRAATAAVLVAMAVLGGAGGALLVRALPSSRPVSLESEAIAETLGELPWNSPVSGLGPILDGAAMQEARP